MKNNTVFDSLFSQYTKIRRDLAISRHSPFKVEENSGKTSTRKFLPWPFFQKFWKRGMGGLEDFERGTQYGGSYPTLEPLGSRKPDGIRLWVDSREVDLTVTKLLEESGFKQPDICEKKKLQARMRI